MRECRAVAVAAEDFAGLRVFAGGMQTGDVRGGGWSEFRRRLQAAREAVLIGYRPGWSSGCADAGTVTKAATRNQRHKHTDSDYASLFPAIDCKHQKYHWVRFTAIQVMERWKEARGGRRPRRMAALGVLYRVMTPQGDPGAGVSAGSVL